MSGEEKMREYEKRLRETTIPTTHVSGSGKMHIEGIGDVHISGSGFVSPEEIKISGSGTLPGGMKVKKISCSGSVSIDGDVEAEDMSFSGSASIASNVKAIALSASGSLSVGGEVKGSLARVAGSCKIGRELELDDALHAHGFLKVLGDVKAKKAVELHGGFDVDGKIVTANLEAELSKSESHVRNGIQAVNVDVRKREAEGLVVFGVPIVGRIFRSSRLYTTDIIAKGTVFLESVSCDNVQGKDVTIGEGCIIKGKVEYSQSISVHPTAKLAHSPEKST